MLSRQWVLTRPLGRPSRGSSFVKHREKGSGEVLGALEALPCHSPTPAGAVETAAKSRTSAGTRNTEGLPVPKQTQSTALPCDPGSSLSHPRLLQAAICDLPPRCLGWHSSTDAVIFQ